MKIECSLYRKSSKVIKSAAITRLSLCAEIVKIAIETGVKRIRVKTTRAVVGHITQTLPGSDGTYCEPLIQDYFKTLKVVLAYPPHAEHFSKDEWCELIDFCNQTLYDLNSVSSQRSSGVLLDGSSSRDLWRGVPSRSATPGTDINSRPVASHIGSQENCVLKLRDCAEEPILCLFHLSSVPHAPILDKAPVVLTNLLNFLGSSAITGNAQQAAFECINTIVACTRSEDSSLTLQTLRSLVPIMHRLWNAKASALKDHMQILLLHSEVYFPSLISLDEGGECKSNLQDLLETIQQDYCKRPEREQLQLDDLVFLTNRCAGTNSSSTKLFELRCGAIKAEKPYFVLSIYASLTLALDTDLQVCEKIAQTDDYENRPKRRKITNHVDEVFHFINSTDTTQRIFALQVLTFIFDKLPPEFVDLDWNLEALLPCLSDDNGLVASWAMLVLARLASFVASKHLKLIIISAADQPFTRSNHFHEFWLQTWQLAARYITSSITCRAACQLMAILLNKMHVQYAEVIRTIDLMITSVDLNGPTDCCDSACILWSIIMLLRGRDNVGIVFDTSEHILRWLCRRWRPSRC